MGIARHYTLNAAEGKADRLLGVIADLVAALGGIEGYQGAELLRDVGQPGRFVFIEKWASVEAHKAGGAQLPKAVVSALMETLAGPPEGAYLEYLKTGG
jgi:quinol monooxygenase YgiN